MPENTLSHSIYIITNETRLQPATWCESLFAQEYEPSAFHAVRGLLQTHLSAVCNLAKFNTGSPMKMLRITAPFF